MIELNAKLHPPLRFAKGLECLQATYAAIPPAWNPSGHGLVRLSIERVLRNNKATTREIRAFLRFTGFTIAGAMDLKTRLFGASPASLVETVDALKHNHVGGPTMRYIANTVGLVENASISHYVGHPDKLADALMFDFHEIKDDPDVDSWTGIAQMLTDLGATKMQRVDMGSNGPGHGYATLDHQHAATIAAHPLVRHVGVVSRIALRS